MKEIKKTIEQVVGYEAFDGTKFNSHEECLRYEQSAESVLLARLKKIIKKEIYENEVFEHEGYGSEEHLYWVVEFKTKEDIDTFNQFAQFTHNNGNISDEYIGKTVLVGTGYCHDSWKYRGLYVKGTYDELVEIYKRDLDFAFKEEDKEDK